MKKQQVFYIHGGNAYSRYDSFIADLQTKTIRELPWEEETQKWSATLSAALGDGYEVFMPMMPNKQNAQYEEWKIWFERHFEFLHDEVILLGWSLGGYFLSKYLLEHETPFTIQALILAAALFEPEDFGGEDGGDFAFATSHVKDLATKAHNIYILHSQDDFVVPYDHALKYAEALPEAELVTFTDKNHFLIPEFPELIELIKQQ